MSAARGLCTLLTLCSCGLVFADRPAPIDQAGYATPDLLTEDVLFTNPLLPAAPPTSGRPRGSFFSTAFDARWEPDSGGVDAQEYWAKFRIVIPPILFGPPPPSLSVNVGRTELDGLGLPELTSVSVGVNWIRPVNDRWALMFNASPTFASDFENTSSDAWRFRGNAFAFYSPSDDVRWIFGAVVTGRSDLPALPAVGVIWWPTTDSKLDLTFPRPRYSRRLTTSEELECWGYVGMDLGGGTWAVRANGIDDELTYRAWRFGVGVEFVPPGANDSGARGRGDSRAYVEAGYSLGREVEFVRAATVIEPDATIYIGGGVQF